MSSDSFVAPSAVYQQQQHGLEGGGGPVDLQDIVEKLNAALVQCRKKNNLQFEESHGQEDFYGKK